METHNTIYEYLFTGFTSKRKDLSIKESNWLNTVTDLTDANNPDSLDFSSDDATKALANVSNEVIRGTDTYRYKEDGLLKNGVYWEADDPAVAAIIPSLCSYCRNS